MRRFLPLLLLLLIRRRGLMRMVLPLPLLMLLPRLILMPFLLLPLVVGAAVELGVVVVILGHFRTGSFEAALVVV